MSRGWAWAWTAAAACFAQMAVFEAWHHDLPLAALAGLTAVLDVAAAARAWRRRPPA